MDFRKIERKWSRKTLTSSRGLRPRSRRASLRGKQESFREIEKKWQGYWEKHSELYGTRDGIGVDGCVDPGNGRTHGSARTKAKKYVLVEFPYPSGSGLHVGHAFTFTGGDVYARYLRMKGYNVMFPMGWDAFGLPTENYAIKTKRKPQEVTAENTAVFKKQMKRLAFSFDWSREINTTDPDYYRWTQWIFIQLFKKGLAYKKKMPINWCPSCKTGLANEEVVDGKCERCGAEVSRRNISQWVVKITDYADRLIEGLEKTDFVEKVKKAQVNWIGRKEWIDIKYPIEGTDKEIVVSTTRPDTNFGATFVVMAPEHPLIEAITNNSATGGQVNLIIPNKTKKEIEEYIKKAKKKSELDRIAEGRAKTGVFTGLYAVNQLNGAKMPIWITDFVLMTVGTGAVVGVPGHDRRDFEFAKQFGLPVIRVVVGKNGEEGEITKIEQVQEEEGMMINSEFLDGMDIQKATAKIMDYLEEKGWGKRAIRYHLRDWIFSRQHYWGEPIPMIKCSKCGWVPVAEKDLPIKLPEVEAYEPTDTGESPLAKIESFVKCNCPVCGGEARRETDTMPNWAGSDWYFLRYIDGDNDIVLADMEKMKYWLPVDVYIGGDEHNTLHLLYSRFIVNFLYDIGAVPLAEPYYKRMSHGVILGSDNQRMSKSRGNVIIPDKVADKYGVDVVRMYLMFMGPFIGTMVWSENTLMGVKRFLDRFEKYMGKNIGQSGSKTASRRETRVIVNKAIKGVEEDIKRFNFNTAIAKLMEALNGLQGLKFGVGKEELRVLIRLMAPFAPYMAEELWFELWKKERGKEGMDFYVSVHASEWPEMEEKYLVDETVIIPVAVNGKKRGEVEISGGSQLDSPDGTSNGIRSLDEVAKQAILEKARALPEIQKWVKGKKIRREIYVPGKMVNFVIG